MKKSRSVFKRVLVAVISTALFLGTIVIPSQKVSAGGYFSADIFTIDRSKKGTQSFQSTEVVNTSNIFVNVFMESSFPNDGETNFSGYDTWEFEGTKYHFKMPEGLYGPDTIYQNITAKDFTLTAQFLLQYDPNKKRLIEPSARPFAGESYRYYAPNMSEPEVVKEYRAYFDYLSHYFSSKNAHIDAWVCGNEVNAPDRWNFYGSDCLSNIGGNKWIISDYNRLMEKYTKFYDIVYDTVKAKNKKARICIRVDHCWTENDGKRMYPTKSFLNDFAAREGNSKDWCIAFHAYPADLTKPNIWADGANNPKHENALFIDGYNLEVLTGYVKSKFGSNHRILLTEQGFSINQGENIQAACLVYTFYKARFDDMIDVFHIMKFPGCGFELGSKASDIWAKLDNGSDSDEQWILSQVAGTIGISSFSQITPNWKSQGTLKNEINNYKANNKYVFDGIDYSPVFDFEYFCANNTDVVYWYTGYSNVEDQKNHPPKEEDMFYYFCRFGMIEERKGSPDFDLAKYKADHPELVALYGDDSRAYYTHYCNNFSADPTQVTAFVKRFYKEVLGRSDADIEADITGINDWTNKLLTKEKSGAEVAYGFVNSAEFRNRDLNNDQFVRTMYKSFFNREPDEGGYAGWYNDLQNGTKTRLQVFEGFAKSGEFKNLCKAYGINPGTYTAPAKPQDPALKPLNVDTSGVNEPQLNAFVERLYDKALDRPSDAGGKEYWKGCILNGKDDQGREYDIRTVISKGFLNSQEYKNRDRNNAEFVLDCYAAFFDRNPVGTEDEPNYWNWVQQLNNGLSRQQLIENGFGNSKEFRNLIESYGFVIK